MIRRCAGRAAAGLAALGGTAADRATSRAGGGSHTGSSSHGGSHSGTTFHSGGSGGGSLGGIVAIVLVALILWLLYRRFARATVGSPQFAAPPLATEAVGAVLGAAFGQDLGRDGAMPHSAPPRPQPPPGLQRIVAADPGFEIETFLQRAEMTFFLVKRGLQRNDATAIRPYLSDAVFAVVSRAIAQMAARHQHALMESLNVRALHLLDAGCNEQGQSLLVHFDLVYRSKTLDDSNRVLSDEGDDGRHGERWAFGRGPAARTPVNGGVIAARCPACGAELRLSLDGTCLHCRAGITNGAVDWVVVDVQPAPFVGYGLDPLIGIAAPTVDDGVGMLRAADATFDMQAFIARVKTAFGTLQDAWCRQDLEKGRSFLSQGAYFAWAAQLESMAAEGRRDVMEGLTVAQVRPTRVVHGRVFDDLTVRIDAAAADYEVDAGGRIVYGDRMLRPFAEEWTFQRSVGTATTGKPGTLENACPNCGAPLALTQIGECRYCKAAVTSGKFDWVVSRIEQETDARAGGPGREDLQTQLAFQVGGAIVGGLLGSLFSDKDS